MLSWGRALWDGGGGGFGGCRGGQFGFRFGVGVGLGFGCGFGFRLGWGFGFGFGGGFGWGFGGGGTKTKRQASCHGLTQFLGYNHSSILKVIMHHYIIIAMTIVPLNSSEFLNALETMREYCALGAARRVPFHEVRCFLPWLVISKIGFATGKQKLLFITNARVLNRFIRVRHFRLDHWGEVFPQLRRGMWACKIDLSNTYFHLPVSSHMQPFLGHRIGDECFVFTGLPFGINLAP